LKIGNGRAGSHSRAERFRTHIGGTLHSCTLLVLFGNSVSKQRRYSSLVRARDHRCRHRYFVSRKMIRGADQTGEGGGAFPPKKSNMQ